MTDLELNGDFLDILRELQRAGAEFLLVGAHAMAVHGVPRATADMDLLVRPLATNARCVLEALKQFGAPLEAHGLTETDLATPGLVYQLGLPPRRIDLLTELSGVSFEEAWSSRVELKLAELGVPVIGREALIRNKLAAGRDKDLVDVRLLQASPAPVGR